jgi:hypothetical protein
MDDTVLAFIDVFAFFWMLLMMAISYSIQQSQIKKPEFPWIEPDALSMPTSREGDEYTIVFGTCWIENPVVAWWGDVNLRAYVKHYTYNKWFNNKREYYVAGWCYDLGAHLILCQGVSDGVKQVKVGDVVVWPSMADPDIMASDGETEIEIDEPVAFGGYDKQGGIIGTIDVQYGDASQTPNEYLQEQLGEDISATRGLTALILRQVFTGMIPTPKPWKALVKRTDVLTNGTAQWYTAKAEIHGSMNPIHMLREIYTNTEWGFAKATTRFPDDVWQAAADTLYDEEFGLSMKWEKPRSTLESFKNDILRHIHGFVYQEPTTGDFIVKLVRDDYDAGSLDVYDDSDVVEQTQFSRGAVYEAVNHVYLRFWDRKYNKPVMIDYQNTALMDQQNGKHIAVTVDYLGVDRVELASILLAREVYQACGFFAGVQIKAKRTMGGLRPGDVFKYSWPPLGVSEMILRVIAVGMGTPKDGQIELKCVEDMFAVQGSAYSLPPDTGWEDPRQGVAEDLSVVHLYEIPFWAIVQDDGITGALALADDSGFLGVAAGAENDAFYVGRRTLLYDYELLLRHSAVQDFFTDGRGNFTPGGEIAEPMPKNADDITIDVNITYARVILTLQVGTYAIVGDEICKVKAVSSGPTTNYLSVTLARGCLDTVPEYHASENSADPGAILWFFESVGYVAGTEYSAGDEPSVKVLTKVVRNQLASADATIHTAAPFNSRMIRPYPPGDFKINTVSYPATFSGQPTLTWAHRDRTQQIYGITEHSDASIGPEAGTTYSIKIYDENNVLIRTETGLTGTSYTYSWEDEMSDCGLQSADPLNTQLRFQLWSVRNGYPSWQHYDLVVQRV